MYFFILKIINWIFKKKKLKFFIHYILGYILFVVNNYLLYIIMKGLTLNIKKKNYIGFDIFKKIYQNRCGEKTKRK